MQIIKIVVPLHRNHETTPHNGAEMIAPRTKRSLKDLHRDRKECSTREKNLSVIFQVKEVVRTDEILLYIKLETIFYNEEFDPGSG